MASYILVELISFMTVSKRCHVRRPFKKFSLNFVLNLVDNFCNRIVGSIAIVMLSLYYIPPVDLNPPPPFYLDIYIKLRERTFRESKVSQTKDKIERRDFVFT